MGADQFSGLDRRPLRRDPYLIADRQTQPRTIGATAFVEWFIGTKPQCRVGPGSGRGDQSQLQPTLADAGTCAARAWRLPITVKITANASPRTVQRMTWFRTE